LLECCFGVQNQRAKLGIVLSTQRPWDDIHKNQSTEKSTADILQPDSNSEHDAVARLCVCVSSRFLQP
jgi:hypothetical protein